MVEQLQVEIQQELKGYHTATQGGISKLSETVEAISDKLTGLTAHEDSGV